ncbi:MAG: 6-pyruvoyl-tetrahydropterin synthase-related protein [Candidatus Omnitrophica bacterium]|nr:6-pyruvoyl-tetrahydropterin synthase-related protein [Candidatus Omnitrophota bacterium]
MARHRTIAIFVNVLILLSASVWACRNLLYEGFHQGHDLSIELVRLAEYTQALKDGQVPVRWSANLYGGYGSPIFNFFPPLFLTLAALFKLSGLSLIVATKWTIFIFTLFGGLGMYLLAKEFYGERGSIFCASLYLLAPYHLVDIYVRNAFSEYSAMMIVPFVFYSLTLILKNKNPSPASNFLLITSGTLLCLSHNLSLMMYGPILIAYALFGMTLYQNPGRIKNLVTSGLAIFCLSAFYMLPLIFEQKFIQTQWLTAEQFQAHRNLFGPDLLFSLNHWGSILPYGAILLSLSLLLLIRRKDLSRVLLAKLALFGIFLGGLIFLMMPVSERLWEEIDFLKIFQFPWRLMSPASFIFCLEAGFLIFHSRPNKDLRHMLIMIIALLGIGLFMAQYPSSFGSRAVIQDRELAPEEIRQKQFRATILDEYRPRWAVKPPQPPIREQWITSEPAVSMRSLLEKPTKIEYQCSVPEKSLSTVHVFYFPGWNVSLDEKAVAFDITPEGLIRFPIEKGKRKVVIQFEKTPIRTAANSISIVGLILYAGLAARSLLRFRQRHFANPST